MAKSSSHVTPLPAELVPTKSSTQLINEHIERLKDSGIPQKVIALSLGFKANYVSQLKDGKDLLPLPRLIAFAAAVRLSDEERRELLHTRLMELHGEKGEFCIETLAQWADDLFKPVGDEAQLLEMWREATSPAPHLTMGLLEDPVKASLVGKAMHDVVQSELKRLADDAAAP